MNSTTEIDAHCHFWQLSRGDYDWLSGADSALDALKRDFMPAEYPGKSRLIIVQAAPTIAETEFLLHLAEQHERIIGIVGWVDLSGEDAANQLGQLAKNPKLRGIRPMLQDIDETDWLLTHTRPDAIATMIELGLRFDALIQPRHLSVLLQFAKRYPDLPIVIDHAAKPDFTTDLSEWQNGIAALAALPQVYCKFSGLLTECPPDMLSDPAAVLQPVTDHLLACFGPDRLIWGSDWPVVTLAAGFDDWQVLSNTLLATLTAAECDMTRFANAATFYGVNV